MATLNGAAEEEEEEEEEVTLQYACCDETSQWKSERTSNAFVVQPIAELHL